MKKQIRIRIMLVVGGVTIVILALLMLPIIVFGPGSANTAYAAACGSTDPMSPSGALGTDGSHLSGEQLSNARIIIGIGQGMGASAYEVKLAAWVAYHESGLLNLTYGTINPETGTMSLGLFQQTPPLWGTEEQVLNPVYASRKFYQALFSLHSSYILSAKDGPQEYLEMALRVQNPSRAAYLNPKHNFLDWEPIVDSALALVGVETLPATEPGTTTQEQTTTTTQTTTTQQPGNQKPDQADDLLPISFETTCSVTSDIGVPGEVIIAPGANNPNEPVTPETLGFVARVAGIYGKPLVCTTGTNHTYFVKGTDRVSDHVSGHACDIGMVANGGGSGSDSPVGDSIEQACLIAAGETPAQAALAAVTGTYGDHVIDGLKVQCIWREPDHHDHVHIGAHPL